MSLKAQRFFMGKEAAAIDEQSSAPQARFKALPPHLVLWSWSSVLERSWRSGSTEALMEAGWKHKAEKHHKSVCWEQTLVAVQGATITEGGSAGEGRSFGSASSQNTQRNLLHVLHKAPDVQAETRVRPLIRAVHCALKQAIGQLPFHISTCKHLLTSSSEG